MIRAAIYSDDDELQNLFIRSFGNIYEVAPKSDENGIRTLVNAEQCDAVFYDISSDSKSADDRIDFARALIASPAWLTIIADDLTSEAAMGLLQLGADAFRRKSSFLRELEIMAENHGALLSSRLGHFVEGARSLQHRRQLIGSGPRIRHILELIDRIADLSAPVLITGETGTGKELIARTIHATSCRADRPFVALSCSAIPESLLEAELFGHEKGAFTGSIGSREGYFERAASGTLFLDEVGDLSLSAQVKLLRVLQERSFCRIGGNREIPLKARLLFATHRDLSKMIQEGSFRSDLFYRMNVVRIDTPSLREHPEDIPELATQFVHHYSREFGRPVTTISAEALAALSAYHWPGNVRELENVIQQAVALASCSCISQDMLPSKFTGEGAIFSPPWPHPRSLDDMLFHEKVRLAVEALRTCAGNKSHAARSLGISRPYLYKLIQNACPDRPVPDRQ